MSAATDTISWGESVARQLLDATTCPACGEDRLSDGRCPQCGADLRGADGLRIWQASTQAAAALRTREELLRRMPRSHPPVTPAAALAPVSQVGAMRPALAVEEPPAPLADPSAPLAGPPAPPAGPPSDALPASHPRRSSATLQSVLAIAGAGLFAIAAIIFTFLNPDLADRGIRNLVVGLVTAAFVAGAWMLSRRGLRFSAEAVGALGLVFVALDVNAFAQLGGADGAAWLRAALATGVMGGALGVAGKAARVRVWQWAAALAVAVVPAMVGYAFGVAYAAALGHLGTAFLAVVILAVSPSIARRSLVALQVAAVVVAVPMAVFSVAWFGSTVRAMLALSLAAALVAAHAALAARQSLRPWWSFVAGGAATAAFVFAVTAPVAQATGQWAPAALPTAAAFGLALVVVAPGFGATSRPMLMTGGIVVTAATSLLPAAFAAAAFLDVLSALVRGFGAAQAAPFGWAPVLGMLGAAAGLALFAGLVRDHEASPPDAAPRAAAGTDSQPSPSLRGFAAGAEVAAIAAVALAVIVLACTPLLALEPRLSIALGASATASIALRALPALRQVSTAKRVALLMGIHAVIATGLLISWLDPRIAPVAGVGVIAALALAGAAVPPRARFVHTGVGVSYALVCLAQALADTAIGGIAVLCLTASAGLLVAIVATFLTRVRARDWYAVLVVASVPFAIAVVQVVFERSGWTALSTSLMFALALALLLTRRPGLNVVLRTAASALLVPTLAVIVVCLGAQLLAVSASPVTLPVIAAIVAVVMPGATLIRDALARRGLGAGAAGAARIAIEASALLTGAIATALALAREAAGLGTTLVVLVLLGAGAAASAAFTGRRYGWWVAGAAFTGALWCAWAMSGVDLLEAYALPPALAACVTAGLLAARRAGVADVRALYATGLAVATLPSLMLLVLTEPDSRTAVGAPWRALALLIAAVVLLVVAGWFASARRETRGRGLAALAPATYIAAGVAAVSGPVQGVRMGLGADLVALHGTGLFLACFGASAVAAVILVVAGHGMRSLAPSGGRVRRSRWAFAPAVLALTAGTWCAIQRDWGSIWMMWMLMIGVLTVMLVAAVRTVNRGHTSLPPVWFLFAIAFVTAVIAWSPRELRVEWFSLPLGAFLLLAGIHSLRHPDPRASRGPSAWPGGSSGSWALLAPGILTMMSASVVATFTDPLTWRAVLVMVFALAAIMAGASRRLAAPFLIGMIVLPIENVLVFSVQIGRGIESMPWWITLAVIGAVLLVIAVTYERRSGEAGSVTARIRDLR